MHIMEGYRSIKTRKMYGKYNISFKSSDMVREQGGSVGGTSWVALIL